MANQQPHPDDWDQHWSTYAEAAAANPAQTMRHELVYAALKDRGGEAHRLLDVGCGQGDFLAGAHKRGLAREYAGFELSASGVAITQRKVPDAKVLQVDLFNPPPAAEAFLGWATAATNCDVIEHVDDPVGLLRSARRYMAPGCTFVLTVPGGPISAFDRHIGHRRHFTPDTLRKVMTDAGFSVTRVHRAGFPFFNVYRAMVIMRGKKLISEVESGAMAGGGGAVARLAMRGFHTLFRFNRNDSRFGWQLVAIARNPTQ